MNNNLIIYYKDKSKDVFSFTPDTSEEQAIAKFEEIRPEVNKEQIEKYFYTENDEIAIDTYGRFSKLEGDKIVLNVRSIIIDEKLEEIKKKRDTFLSRLDIPFMRALEDDQEDVKNHIKTLKNFLRDLPDNLKFTELNNAELLEYNPFGNIFEIALIYGGEGYKRPPKVTVDKPKEPQIGFAPKVTALIKDEKVVKLVITDYGCGYNHMPLVTIEEPEEGKRAAALCLPPQNVMLTEDEIMENTRRRYSK